MSSRAPASTAAGIEVEMALSKRRAESRAQPAQRRKSGAADALTQMGINVMGGPAVAQQALDVAGICFMMAPITALRSGPLKYLAALSPRLDAIISIATMTLKGLPRVRDRTAQSDTLV